MGKTAILLGTIVVLFGTTGCRKSYGEKLSFGKLDVYYKDGVSEETARAVGKFLMKENFSDNTRKLSVQITRVDGVITFRMVTKENYKSFPGGYYLMRALVNKMSRDVFKGAPVNYHLCDKKFKTLEAFPFRRLDVLSLPGLDLEYEPPVTKDEVERLGAYFVKVGFAKKGRNLLARLTSPGGRLTFLFFIKPDRVSRPETVAAMQDMGRSISTNVFAGQPVDVHMTDAHFKVVKKVPFTKSQ